MVAQNLFRHPCGPFAALEGSSDAILDGFDKLMRPHVDELGRHACLRVLQELEDLSPDDIGDLQESLLENVVRKREVRFLNSIDNHGLEDPWAIVNLMKQDLHNVLAISMAAQLLQRCMERLGIKRKLQFTEEVDEALRLVVHQRIVQRSISELIWLVHDLLSKVSKVH